MLQSFKTQKITAKRRTPGRQPQRMNELQPVPFDKMSKNVETGLGQRRLLPSCLRPAGASRVPLI